MIYIFLSCIVEKMLTIINDKNIYGLKRAVIVQNSPYMQNNIL